MSSGPDREPDTVASRDGPTGRRRGGHLGHRRRVAQYRRGRGRFAGTHAGGTALAPGGPPAGDAAVLEERARFLRWLHDSPLQALDYVAARGWRDPGDADPADLARVAALAAEELRRFIREQGEPAGSGAFFKDVGDVVDEARRLGSHRIELVRGPIDGSSGGARPQALIGALREALTNARKHAGATRVVVYCEEEGGRAVITVRDDGVGASADRLHSGFGVRHSILDRMRAAGGWAHVEQSADGGVVVRLGADGMGLGR